MIKLMSFKLRDNVNLIEQVEDKIEGNFKVTNLEVAGIDKDTIWVLVKLSDMEYKTFDKRNLDNFEPKEPKSFGGNN